MDPSAPAQAGSEAESVADAAPKVELRILLLSSGDEESSVQAWRLLLERLGIPFDVFCAGAGKLTPATLEFAPGHGRYQAIVLATDSLVCLRDGVYRSALEADEWEALREYESRYQIRRVSAYATPGPQLGLTSPTWGGDVGGTAATLTSAGRAVFAELVGSVPFTTGTYGYVSTVTGELPFKTLVESAPAAPVVGVVTHPDGREELLVTVASGPTSRHLHLLGPGILSWATHGSHFGFRDFYLSVQVDDVLLGVAVPPPGDDPLRMSPADLLDTARWSDKYDTRLDLAYNAWGAVARTGIGIDDPLAVAITETTEAFAWLNHTFGHLDLDTATSAQIRSEIVLNLDWARDNDVPVDVGALVTGGHSGLENSALHEVADECGIRWLASDASREPGVRTLGRAHTVPRYPINIPLDIATLESWAQRTAIGAGTTVEELLRREADLILDHLLGNDPRPHYTHQNALVGDRLLLGLLEMALNDYRALIVDLPVQLTLSEAGTELVRRATWSELETGSNAITASVQGDVVTIRNDTDADVDVPYTAESSPTRRGWMRLSAHSVERLPSNARADPANDRIDKLAN